MATTTKNSTPATTTTAPVVRVGMGKGDSITLKVLAAPKTSNGGKTFMRAVPLGSKVGEGKWENSNVITIFAGNKMEFPDLNIGDTFSFSAGGGIAYSLSEYEGVKKYDGITNFNFADQISNIKIKPENFERAEKAKASAETSDI